MRALRNFFKISWADRLLLFETAASLILVRIAVMLIPIKHLAPYLGQNTPVPEDVLSQEAEIMAKRIGWAVHVMARHIPWKSTCLVKSIAAKRILQRRHIPSSLYLGVAKNDQNVLEAHAWLQCGTFIVTGKFDKQHYTNLISFTDHYA